MCHKGCIRTRCRELRHLGFNGSFGVCPKGCSGNIYDCTNALGVICARCGHYWIPEGVPQELIDTCEPWELPGGWRDTAQTTR